MSKITNVIAVGAILAAGTATSTLAHDTSGIDWTQRRQHDLIEQGRRDGSITRREYRDLLSEQARIAEMERRAKADGRVTGREVHAIRDAQHSARTHIVEEGSDRQMNFWRRWKSRHGL